MAIVLPPPVIPQQGDAAQLQSAASAVQTVGFQDYRVHVFGSQAVPLDEVKRVIAQAETVSDAVRAIGYAWYVAGYPATRVNYALVDHDLYVQVQPQRLISVQAPPLLMPYFDDLPRKPGPLRDTQLEMARALADGLTERAGEDYKPQLKPLKDDGVVLDLGAPAPGAHQTQFTGEFSDYGNRYSGRYLVDALLRQAFASGDELQLGGTGSIRGLTENSQPYWEGEGSWSHLTTSGVFGLQTRYIDYDQATGTPQHGRIWYGAGTWLFPLYADFRRRLTLQTRLDYSNQRSERRDTGAELLSEIYYSAELTGAYVERRQWSGREFEWQFNVTGRHGLGNDAVGADPANLSYWVLRPSAAARYAPVPQWSFALEGAGQFSRSTLPQQEQLVIGGPDSLHAFAPGVGVGDHGGNARLSAEWRGWQGRRFDLRPKLLAEYGLTALAHETPDAPSGTLQLADVAAEVELRYRGWLQARFSAAKHVFANGEENSPDALSKTFYYFKLAFKL
jgi:hypothetical protein